MMSIVNKDKVSIATAKSQDLKDLYLINIPTIFIILFSMNFIIFIFTDFTIKPRFDAIFLKFHGHVFTVENDQCGVPLKREVRQRKSLENAGLVNIFDGQLTKKKKKMSINLRAYSIYTKNLNIKHDLSIRLDSERSGLFNLNPMIDTPLTLTFGENFNF
ncbi:DUF4806 domain-containing protein [Aphis craccivora]|uniref:DUF4806 domain-containing protein n=1 Tax=Aphis craccivora TaxID=307492 RepID=A0A6G0VYI7_APHCR|nr:DUF4806 domain-containing protein [Aphis craccivora]